MIKLEYTNEKDSSVITYTFPHDFHIGYAIEQYESFLKGIGFGIASGEYLGIRGRDEDKREPTVDDYVDLCDYRNVEDFLSDKPIEEVKAMINFGLGMSMDSKFRESAEQVLSQLEKVQKTS